MTLNPANELPMILEKLLEATLHLQMALRRADADGILNAVHEQTESLRKIELLSASKAASQDVERLKSVVKCILDANRMNKILSQDGLRSIRTTLRGLMPQSEYGPTGEMQIAGEPDRVHASV